MESLFPIFFVIFIILSILIICAEYNFINVYRKRGLIKKDAEYNTLIFLFLNPEYNLKVLLLAFSRVEDESLEKARKFFLISVIITLLYIFCVEIYFRNV